MTTENKGEMGTPAAQGASGEPSARGREAFEADVAEWKALADKKGDSGDLSRWSMCKGIEIGMRRALSLFFSDAAGVPEPSPAKGPSPSEVPQPGEGVDLEDGVGAELADYFERLGIREERQAWVNTLYPEKLRLLAMTLGQRALRRESK